MSKLTQLRLVGPVLVLAALVVGLVLVLILRSGPATGAASVPMSGSSAAQAIGPPPPPPPGVRPDGTVDCSKVPEFIGLAAFDGQPVRDAAGNEVKVPNVVFLHCHGMPSEEQMNAIVKQSNEAQLADALRRGLTPPPPPQVVESS